MIAPENFIESHNCFLECCMSDLFFHKATSFYSILNNNDFMMALLQIILGGIKVPLGKRFKIILNWNTCAQWFPQIMSQNYQNPLLSSEIDRKTLILVCVSDIAEGYSWFILQAILTRVYVNGIPFSEIRLYWNISQSMHCLEFLQIVFETKQNKSSIHFDNIFRNVFIFFSI